MFIQIFKFFIVSLLKFFKKLFLNSKSSHYKPLSDFENEQENEEGNDESDEEGKDDNGLVARHIEDIAYQLQIARFLFLYHTISIIN